MQIIEFGKKLFFVCSKFFTFAMDETETFEEQKIKKTKKNEPKQTERRKKCQDKINVRTCVCVSVYCEPIQCRNTTELFSKPAPTNIVLHGQ